MYSNLYICYLIYIYLHYLIFNDLINVLKVVMPLNLIFLYLNNLYFITVSPSFFSCVY